MLALLSVPACGQNQAPLGELFASDNSGQKSLQLAGSGMSVVSGSELSAGIAPATLRLLRGGQIRICPRSGLSVSASGQGLMLATGAGAIEVQYQVTQQATDVLITPDLNVMLVGPGTFHFALGVKKNGDTCIKSMPGNTGKIAFSELMGTSTYQAQPNETSVFLRAALDAKSPLTEGCGCPPTAEPVMQAEATPTPTPAKDNEGTDAKGTESVAVETTAPTTPLPPDRPGQVHVQVDAPFVFSGRSAAERTSSVAKVQYSELPNVFFVQEKVDPVVLTEKPPQVSLKADAETVKPAEPQKKEKKGFFGKLKGFFGSLFHR